MEEDRQCLGSKNWNYEKTAWYGKNLVLDRSQQEQLVSKWKVTEIRKLG